MKGAIIAVILLLCSCTPSSNRYIIEGTTSKSDGFYYLFSGYDVVDSAEVISGRYRFEGEVDSLIPIRNIGSTNLIDRFATTRFAPVILEQGTITVTEDDNSPTGGLVVSGTKGNNAIRDFVISGMELQERNDFAFSTQERKQINQSYNKLVIKIIERNLNNFASVYMLTLSGDRFSDEQKSKYISRLSPAMQKTKAIQDLKMSLQTTKTE